MGADGKLDQVAVAGGTGLVGRHLAAFLAAGGVRVILLSRSERVAGLPEGVVARNWRDLPGVLEGAGAVVNLCGEGIAGRRWSASRREALLESRVGPTVRLVNALGALQARPGVLVNASATGYYGPMDERPLDESAGPGTGFLAQLCRRWEAAADGAAACGVRVVKLRLGMVLARDGGALPRLALPARLFLGARLGRGRQGISWIHVDDLVRLVLEAAANPACRGPVNATALVPVTNEAFTRALCRRLGRPMLPVPGWLTAAALRLGLGEMGEAMLLQGNFAYPRAAERLGFQFRFPQVDQALADLLG